jgi:hypothetical protein
MADMMEMYVTVLFEELAFLGVTQRDVARHFGVSEQMASRWARGVVPVTRQRGEEFITFVQAKEQEALERAKRPPRSGPRATVLTGAIPTPEEVLQDRINSFWARWDDELQERNGGIYDDLVLQLHALRPFMGMDAAKLREMLNTSPSARRARTTILSAAKLLTRDVHRLERMKPLGGTQE